MLLSNKPPTKGDLIRSTRNMEASRPVAVLIALIPLSFLIYFTIFHLFGNKVEATVTFVETDCFQSTAFGDCLRYARFFYYRYPVDNDYFTDMAMGNPKEGTKLEVTYLPFAPDYNVASENGRIGGVIKLMLVFIVIIGFGQWLFELNHKRIVTKYNLHTAKAE